MRAEELIEDATGVDGKQTLIDYFEHRWIDFDQFPDIEDTWFGFLRDEGYDPDDFDDADYSMHSREFYAYISSRGWLRHWRNQYGKDLPAWMWLDVVRVLPRTTWMVHLTSYPNEISTRGFTKGVALDDLDTNLAFTWDNGVRSYQHTGAGYCFGVMADDEKTLGDVAWGHANAEHGYGSHAVLFQAGGVLVHHNGDHHQQTIFWGPSVNPKRVIPLTHRESGWWTGGGRKSTYLPALVGMIRQGLSSNVVQRK